MEVFRRGTKAAGLFKILERYPGQVVILRNTAEIARLRPRKKGLLNRLTDVEQTEGFPKYAAAVAAGHPKVITHLEAKQKHAKEFLDDFLPEAESLKKRMLHMLDTFTQEDLSELRSKRKQITVSLARRIEVEVAQTTRTLYADTLGIQILPATPDIKYSFPFRFAVCYYSLACRWGHSGGLQGLSVKDFRNDLNDCTYAAYASFYDGLITCDDRLSDVYNLSIKLLEGVFGIADLSAREIPVSA